MRQDKLSDSYSKINFVIPAGFAEQYSYHYQVLNTILTDKFDIALEISERENWTPLKILSEPQANLVLVGIYESLYLETFFEYHSLLKFQNTSVQGLIISHHNSTFNHLAELRGLTTTFLLGNDFLPLNPLIYYLLKYTNVTNYHGHFKNIEYMTAELQRVIDGEISAAIIDSHQFLLLPTSIRSNLRIWGRFPIVNEQVAVLNTLPKGCEPSAFFDKTAASIAKYAPEFRVPYLINSVNREEFAFLIEGIEGLGYNLKEFIESYPNIILQAIAQSFIQEYHELQNKYRHQVDFNEKLVKMYHEVRDSRDQLISDNRQPAQNVVMFDKSGQIIGASRGFLKLIQSKRQDIIGKELSEYVVPKLNKTLEELIPQIDCELIKSFNVHIHRKSGETVEAKFIGNIIELENSKYVLGLINPKE